MYCNLHDLQHVHIHNILLCKRCIFIPRRQYFIYLHPTPPRPRCWCFYSDSDTSLIDQCLTFLFLSSVSFPFRPRPSTPCHLPMVVGHCPPPLLSLLSLLPFCHIPSIAFNKPRLIACPFHTFPCHQCVLFDW